MGMEAAVLGSAAIGALGSKKSKQENGGQIDPYTFFPEVKDAYKSNVLPQAAQIAQQQYPSRPMQRVASPQDDPFASQALFSLQQARDNQAANPAPAAPQAQAQVNQGALDDLRKELQGAMQQQSQKNPVGKGGWINQSPYERLDPDTGRKLQQYYGLTPDQQGVLGAPGGGSNIFKQMYGFDPYGGA